MKLLCCSLMNSYSWIQWICYFTFVAIFFLMDMTHSTSITLWWSTCSLSIIWWQINKREIEPSSQVEATWGRLQTIHSQCCCWLCITGGEILSCWYLQLSCSCSSKEIPKYQEGRAPVWVCHAQWTKIGWLKCFKYEAIQQGFNSFPVHQCLEHPLFDCFGPWFSLITWDQWIWGLQLCGTRGQCHTTSQSCRLTFAMSHAATGQFIYLMDDGCSSHLEMWNRASCLVRSPCTWSRNLQIYFGDMEHKSLVYPSLIAKTHPRHFDGAPLIKMLILFCEAHSSQG